MCLCACCAWCLLSSLMCVSIVPPSNHFVLLCGAVLFRAIMACVCCRAMPSCVSVAVVRCCRFFSCSCVVPSFRFVSFRFVLSCRFVLLCVCCHAVLTCVSVLPLCGTVMCAVCFCCAIVQHCNDSADFGGKLCQLLISQNTAIFQILGVQQGRSLHGMSRREEYGANKAYPTLPT